MGIFCMAAGGISIACSSVGELGESWGIPPDPQCHDPLLLVDSVTVNQGEAEAAGEPGVTDLAVQTTGDDTDGTRAPVDGEHEVMGVLWLLAVDGVGNHPIVGLDGIILICGCHLHH